MSDERYAQLTKKYNPHGLISKFVGRRATPEDQKIFAKLAEVFAPAKDQPFTVWGEWSEWQREKMLRDTEESERKWEEVKRTIDR